MKAELTTLYGLDVYTDRGKRVGVIEDVVIDAKDRKVIGIAVGNVNPDVFDVNEKGIIVPYKMVMAVGDIVLMKQLEKRFKREDTDN